PTPSRLPTGASWRVVRQSTRRGRSRASRYGRRVRGQYKVPGGKLVTVEVDIDDDRLANVHVAGDFFLEPDSALEDIDRALTGMPAGATGPQLAEAVTAALGPDVAMVGFDAPSVGIAVRRAVGAATGWDDHVFEIIEPVV